MESYHTALRLHKLVVNHFGLQEQDPGPGSSLHRVGERTTFQYGALLKISFLLLLGNLYARNNMHGKLFYQFFGGRKRRLV